MSYQDRFALLTRMPTIRLESGIKYFCFTPAQGSARMRLTNRGGDSYLDLTRSGEVYFGGRWARSIWLQKQMASGRVSTQLTELLVNPDYLISGKLNMLCQQFDAICNAVMDFALVQDLILSINDMASSVGIPSQPSLFERIAVASYDARQHLGNVQDDTAVQLHQDLLNAEGSAIQ